MSNDVRNAFHQLRGRAARGAPITLQHVEAAERKIKRIVEHALNQKPPAPKDDGDMWPERKAREQAPAARRFHVEPQVTPRDLKLPPRDKAF